MGEINQLRDNLLLQFSVASLVVMAIAGENTVEIKVPDDVDNEQERRLGTLMEVYTPIIFPGSSEAEGVLEIYQYYLPTARRVDSLRRWVFGSLAIGFLVLYGTLVSIVWEAWITIRKQRTRLESFNCITKPFGALQLFRKFEEWQGQAVSDEDQISESVY